MPNREPAPSDQSREDEPKGDFLPGQHVITDRGMGVVLDWRTLEKGEGYIIDPSAGKTLEACKVVPDTAYKEAHRLVNLTEVDVDRGGVDAVYGVEELQSYADALSARIRLRLDQDQDPSSQPEKYRREQIGETHIRPDGLPVTLYEIGGGVEQVVGAVGGTYSDREVEFLDNGNRETGLARLIQEGLERPEDSIRSKSGMRAFQEELMALRSSAE